MVADTIRDLKADIIAVQVPNNIRAPRPTWSRSHHVGHNKVTECIRASPKI
jgi:hypothetical protein